MEYYAGIGSRETPSEILYSMEEIAEYMSSFDWTLRSGGANGADSAFEKMAKLKEVYLPWKGFNRSNSPLYGILDTKVVEISRKVWNDRFEKGGVVCSWDSLKETTKLMMIRNCYQILGQNLTNPSKLVICWTKDGEETGGTGQALWLAKMINESIKVHYRIKIINLQKEAHRTAMRNAIKSQMDPIKLWSYDVDPRKGI